MSLAKERCITFEPIVGQVYYYVSIPYCCHVEDIKVKSDTFKGNPLSICKYNLYQTQQEAEEIVIKIKLLFNFD